LTYQSFQRNIGG